MILSDMLCLTGEVWKEALTTTNIHRLSSVDWVEGTRSTVTQHKIFILSILTTLVHWLCIPEREVERSGLYLGLIIQS